MREMWLIAQVTLILLKWLDLITCEWLTIFIPTYLYIAFNLGMILAVVGMVLIALRVSR